MIVRFRSPERDRAIGQRVQNARRRQKRTQMDLAGIVGVSHSMLGKLERGERHWTLEAVVCAAQALHVPPEFIMGEALDVLHTLTTPDPDAVLPRQDQPAAGPPPTPAAATDTLDLSMLDETDRTMMVAMHAVMARRTMRLAA